MKERIGYIFKLFLFLIVSFVLQKPLFMLYNKSAADMSEVGLSDFLDVAVYGLRLDAATAAYLTVIPLVIVFVSFFHPVNIRKWMTPYYISIASVLSLIFVADMVIYTFWGFKLNSSALFYAEHPREAVASVSAVFLTAGVLAVVFLTALYVYALCVLTPVRFHAFRARKAWTSVMIPIAALMFLFIRGGTDESTSNISDVYYSDKEFLNHSAVNPAFYFFYSLSKSEKFDKTFNFFPLEEARTLVADIFTTESIGGENLLNCPRPNILLIIWEGCAGYFVEATGGEKGVTPCLNDIARRGVSFTNCHAGSFRTDRGVVCILNGWLGLPTASIMKMTEKSRTLPSLALSLGNEGYHTDFWYGGDIGFTNMKSYLYESGYEKLYGDTHFPKEYRNYSKWGVPDHLMLDCLATDILSRKKGGRWFTTALTLSSHEPWDVPYHRLKEKKRNSFAYTDSCVGTFINRLQKSEVWDSLLVIIVPDHGIKKDDGQLGSDYRIAHIPMIWTGGAVKGGKSVDTLMGQSDMAATLLGQLHISHERFLFSRDIFSKTYRHPSAFHTFNNGMTFMDSTGVSTFDNDMRKVIFTGNEGALCGDTARVEQAKAILQILYEDISGR
ncbi:MAG: sulfatase-like hydrolase/transferase [Bacteroides sp.]|nr:sulfatase-like hydrolase/transferase [Roseburia sp.]MCM1346716.1 sulfatase-like hydrolase/transferase [Bacteroides sp.]MCM1421303.1 sulfatase-like hydrolase/transferase [Bacteroides sp.]